MTLEERYQLPVQEAWGSFLESLEFSEGGGFALFFLLIPDPSGEGICRSALAEHLRLHSQTLAPFVAATPETLRLLPAALLQNDHRTASVLWVSATDHETPEWEAAWRSLLQRLNENRNRLFTHVPLPLVLCVRPSVRALCREDAPDLWSIRAEVTEIVPRAEPVALRSVDYSEPARLTSYGFNGDPRIPLEEVDRLRNRAGSERTVLRNLIRAAEAFQNRYEWAAAQGVLEEALPLLESYSTPTQHAEIAWMLGESYFRQSQLPQAATWFGQGRTVANNSKNIFWEANCLKGLADIHLRKSELEQAESRYKEASILYESAGDKLGEANCLKGLADIHLQKSELEQAESRYEEASHFYKSAGDKIGEASCIQGLARIHLNKSELEQAESRYKEASILFKSAGGKIGEANCIQGLADIHLQKSELEQAESRYEEASILFKSAGGKIGEANCIHYLGMIAFHQARYEEARSRMEAACQMYVVANIISNVAESLFCQSFLPASPEAQAALRERARAFWGQYLAPEQLEEYEQQVRKELPTVLP